MKTPQKEEKPQGVSTRVNSVVNTVHQKKNSRKKTIKFVFLGGADFPYLPKKALEFANFLLSIDINCSVDIINQRHHKVISEGDTLLTDGQPELVQIKHHKKNEL